MNSEVTPSFILSLSIEKLGEWLHERNEPLFRAKQIFEWLWRHCTFDCAKMSNLSLSLRTTLSELFIVNPLTLISTSVSEDGETTKFLWKLFDGHFIESVLIRAPGRSTVCVSSQVGCAVRCAFCASGKAGFIRDLYTAEIVAQVLAIQHEEMVHHSHLTNVVYMGMGEPLQNYEAVAESIRFLSDPSMFGMSKRRITVSTVGIVENIKRLADDGLEVNLALSLHAPTQDLRKKIIPYARQYDLDSILKAVDYYHAITGRNVTYEYILLSGVNDREEDAKNLGMLLHSRQGSVNLIPYNTVSEVFFARSSTKNIKTFRACLDRFGITNTCRYTKGTTISAACGQLALRQTLEGDDHTI